MKNKIINFLFPGDVVRVKMSYEYNKFLKIPSHTDYLYFTIGTVTYDFKDKEYRCLLENSKSDVHSCYILISLKKNIIKFIIMSNKYGDAIVNSHKINLTIDDVISRDVSGDGDYCRYLCSLRSKKICRSMDKSCEHFINGNCKSTVLIGDYVFRKDINNSTRHRIYKLVKGSFGFVFCGKIGNAGVFLLQEDEIILSKKKSIMITFNVCKLCILSSCDRCELKPLKDLNILHK